MIKITTTMMMMMDLGERLEKLLEIYYIAYMILTTYHGIDLCRLGFWLSV